MNKVVSCGGIIKVGKLILITKSTGSRFWNLPKGITESGESSLLTAVRLIKLLTNIDLRGISYVDLGLYSYLQDKNLHLFLFLLDKKPTSLACTSTFTNKKGLLLPLICAFKWCTIDEALRYFSINIVNVICKVFLSYEI